MDCSKLKFSERLSSQRVAQAEKVLGKILLSKLIAYVLFLLGVSRVEISKKMLMPEGSIRSLVRSVNFQGINGFVDKRSNVKPNVINEENDKVNTVEIESENKSSHIKIRGETIRIKLNDGSPKQKRILLLSLVSSGILTAEQASVHLKLSVDRTRKLSKKLTNNDIEAVIDQRQGQQQEFVFTPEIKAQLIQQFVLAINTEEKTSGAKLSKDLSDRCNYHLSTRSINYHLKKLGLPNIKLELLENLGTKKKD